MLMILCAELCKDGEKRCIKMSDSLFLHVSTQCDITVTVV